MGQALYRKYRSKSLAELVGQEHITKTLANALESGRVSHAYLFTGPRGVGKTSVARILAHEINQLPYDGEELHLDIIEIDAASNNGVEDVRDLREKVMLAPANAKYKVYIIDEVHMLSNAAFNALLKTLEEPPAHVVFILATTEVHKLPATIISRTQRFHFQPVTREKVMAHLAHIAKEEGIEIDEPALELVADYGEGSFRDSISLLDQLRSAGAITPDVVETTLGIAPQTALQELLGKLLAGNVHEMLGRYEALLGSGITPQALSQQLIRLLRLQSAGNPALYPLIEQLIEVPRAYNPRLKLEIILAQFALQQNGSDTPPPPPPTSGKKAAPKKAEPAKKAPPKLTIEEVDQKTEKAPEAAPAPAEITAATDDPPAPAEAEVPAPVPVAAPATDGTLAELTDELWQAVVMASKFTGPVLNTVVRQAIPHFDPEKQLLTLTFRFGVHQKQMEENRHKQVFTKILQEVIGFAPQMQTVVNKQAVKHITPAAPAPQHPDQPPQESASPTDSVMGLMGGGEIVSV